LYFLGPRKRIVEALEKRCETYGHQGDSDLIGSPGTHAPNLLWKFTLDDYSEESNFDESCSKERVQLNQSENMASLILRAGAALLSSNEETLNSDASEHLHRTTPFSVRVKAEKLNSSNKKKVHQKVSKKKENEEVRALQHDQNNGNSPGPSDLSSPPAISIAGAIIPSIQEDDPDQEPIRRDNLLHSNEAVSIISEESTVHPTDCGVSVTPLHEGESVRLMVDTSSGSPILENNADRLLETEGIEGNDGDQEYSGGFNSAAEEEEAAVAPPKQPQIIEFVRNNFAIDDSGGESARQDAENHPTTSEPNLDPGAGGGEDENDALRSDNWVTQAIISSGAGDDEEIQMHLREVANNSSSASRALDDPSDSCSREISSAAMQSQGVSRVSSFTSFVAKTRNSGDQTEAGGNEEEEEEEGEEEVINNSTVGVQAENYETDSMQERWNDGMGSPMTKILQRHAKVPILPLYDIALEDQVCV
jgi:hypothetical protein